MLAFAAFLAVATPLTVDDCVAEALRRAPGIAAAQARVAQFEARLAEVQAVYTPKLSGLAFVAPMYTVEGDINHYDRKWEKLSYWGPYAHLEAVLAQPLYTFGRAEAGADAARARADVERARVTSAENVVALEVKRLYYARLFALSMQPALKTAKDNADKALAQAERLYEEGSGEVTQTDLERLRYAQAEVDKYILLADNGAVLALAALKHTMGLPASAPLEVAASELPPLPEGPDPELAVLLVEAAGKRPEWQELGQGRKAALALADAEKLASAPVLFVGATTNLDWAPTRQDAKNPYWSDPYNNAQGGVALGLQFNLDPWAASAKADAARALGDEVDALSRFAGTGIPLQVQKAWSDVAEKRRLTDIAGRGVAAARKWMTFASAAYGMGTGPARDLLEGLVAFVQARRNYFEALQGYHTARAELDYAVGRH